MIVPDNLGGMFMAQLVTKPIDTEFLDLLNIVLGTSYHMEEIGYNSLKTEYRNKTLREFNISATTGMIVLKVKENVKGLIPGPGVDTIIVEYDYLIVLGSDSKLKHFVKKYTLIKYDKL